MLKNKEGKKINKEQPKQLIKIKRKLTNYRRHFKKRFTTFSQSSHKLISKALFPTENLVKNMNQQFPQKKILFFDDHNMRL